MTIPTLIDKQDTFEIVRDQIAAILKLEIISQMALAVVAGKDPVEWDIRIFTERSNPFEQYLSDPVDQRPIVNIWYDNSNFPQNRGDTVARQASETVYNIDCYGYGSSKDEVGPGHIPGDREAAFQVQKTIRLVRNILMAAEYAYLKLQGTVWQRWPQSVTVFQPQLDANQIEKIVGARVAFSVTFNEFSPQVESNPLELVSVDVFRAETGEILLEADYDYTI